MEEAAAAFRLAELAATPIPGAFDYAHMKAIHGYVFQDVYEWAGQERVAPTGFMTKDGHSYYGAGEPLTAAAEKEYSKLASKDLLRGLDQEEFVGELAESWGELNVVHSFREGNTRTQFVFFSQLAEQAGYRIDTAAFAPGEPLRDEFVRARFHSQDTSRNDHLAAVLGKAIHPLTPTRDDAAIQAAALSRMAFSRPVADAVKKPATGEARGPSASRGRNQNEDRGRRR
jgi:cell filamentation protein